MVQPAGVTSQFTIIENGSRTKKQRLTHDLTYAATFQGASVNSCINMTKYPEMVYGWCFGRVVHFVVALRAEHPDSWIFIAKYDFSDAYRRVAHTARAAEQTILVMGRVAYVMLRLAFGGSPNPPAWCAFSEMVTDLANEIPLCSSWDPTRIRSPAQKKTPSPRELPHYIPLSRACPTAVRVPTSVTATTDCFIDDLILV
jgi:hypothetical protein